MRDNDQSMPRPSVVFACAAADAPLVARVVPRLVELGTRVEIVDGVDLDTRPLEAAVERHTERTAYVVCQSEELDEYQRDLLVLTIRAGEVPEALVWPIRLEPHDVDGLMGGVLKHVLELGWLAEARQHAKGRRRNVTLRGMAMPPVEPPKKRKTAPTRLYGEELSSEAARAEPRVRKPVVPRVVPANVTKRIIPAPPPIPRSASASKRRPAPTVEPKPIAPPPVTGPRPIAARPAVVASPPRATASQTEKLTTVDAQQAVRTTEKGAPQVIVDTAPEHQPVTGPPVRSGYTTPSVPILVAPRQSARTEIAEVAPPRRRRWLGALAAAAAVALVWMAIPDDAASSAAAATDVAAVSSTERTVQANAATERADDTQLAREHGDGSPEADGRDSANATDVHGALFTREIRALDAMLVADLGADLRYRDGRAACLSLVRGGEDGWRLPTPEELRALARAGFLSSQGSWWTGGAGNKKKRAVWNGKRVRQKAASRRVKAKTVCVSSV